ncbi:hypothetical protein LWI29_016146 [Acer saccharum]|uniref:Uncharacterized protein n=1 Tax=Acer saccharum TaxID=4024 RepID=A0AA39V7U3_ACESA|nr:hypothetical protein LWI29_016146 [Acer saccharum]
MSTTLKLSKDASGKSVDQTLYHGMIGSLLYLTASRPDISFSVGVCARYQSDPKESHLSSVKRVIRFVNGTSNYGIWYSFDTNPSLVGYSDADWAGNCDDRKSTSGGCFFLGNNLVSWFCKKQNSISLSTAEAEYIAAGSGCTQLMWMKQMLVDYGFNQGTLTLFCDNMSAINISKNPVQHSRTKHIDIRHHFIRELVENKCIVLEHCSETSAHALECAWFARRPPMEMHLASPWFSPLLVIGGRYRRPGRRMKTPFEFGGWMAADLKRRFRPD